MTKRWVGVTGLLVGCFSAWVLAADGPLTPLMNLPARTDANGYLMTTIGGYTAPVGPLTPMSSLRGRTDSNGYLITTLGLANASGVLTNDGSGNLSWGAAGVSFPITATATAAAIQTDTTSGHTLLLQGYTGAAYSSLLTITNAATPTLGLANVNAMTWVSGTKLIPTADSTTPFCVATSGGTCFATFDSTNTRLTVAGSDPYVKISGTNANEGFTLQNGSTNKATFGLAIQANQFVSGAAANDAVFVGSSNNWIFAPDGTNIGLKLSASALTFGSAVVSPAASGTRYVCIDTTGKIASSASACSGT